MDYQKYCFAYSRFMKTEKRKNRNYWEILRFKTNEKNVKNEVFLIRLFIWVVSRDFTVISPYYFGVFFEVLPFFNDLPNRKRFIITHFFQTVEKNNIFRPFLCVRISLFSLNNSMKKNGKKADKNNTKIPTKKEKNNSVFCCFL